MSTDPFQIDGVKVAVPDPHDPFLQGASLPHPHDAGASPRPSGDQVILSGSEPRYATLIQKKSQSNALAGGFRRHDQALHALGQKIGALKAPLQTIVKTYPPFAPEDQARVKLLRQYSGIRKEIDALTMPHPPDPAKKALRAPELPAALPADVSDSQINDHLQQLDAAEAALAGARQALASAAVEVAAQTGAFGDFFEGNPVATPGYAQRLTEVSAREKSAEVGQQFASTRQGVGIGPSQFLRTLG